MSRRQERLYVQRRLQVIRQREQAANESAQRQQHEQDIGRTRGTNWWRFEGDGGATKLGSRYSSTCCSPPMTRQELASPARDGYPLPSTATCSMLERSWKTFRVGKACDEWRSTEATSRRSQSVDAAVGREAKSVAVRGPQAAAGSAVAAGGKISHEDRPREGGRTLSRRWVHAADGGFECSV
jgi:hypothetical protein